jgi:hypothetical protein
MLATIHTDRGCSCTYGRRRASTVRMVRQASARATRHHRTTRASAAAVRGGLERQREQRHCASEKRSMMTAKYSQPSSVAIYVTSPAQTRSGCPGSKLRFSSLGAMGSECRESVVQRNFLFCAPFRPLSRISSLTRFLLMRTPRARSSGAPGGLPYVPRLRLWAAAISAETATWAASTGAAGRVFHA